MSAIGLATRGYICFCPTAVLASSVGPSLETQDLAPNIEAHTVTAPKNIVESVPELKPKFKPQKPPKKRRH